jgi:hypothetical protein
MPDYGGRYLDRGVRVVCEMERFVMERGRPKMSVSDNGCALTSMAVLRWSIGWLDWYYIAPASQSRMHSLKSSIAACVTSASTSIS